MALSLADAVAGIVDRDRRSMRWYAAWAAAVIVLGVVVFLGSQFLQRLSPSNFDVVVKIGAGFIASLSLFPIKEIIERRQRIDTLQWLLHESERQDADYLWFEALIKDRLRKEAGA
jgi:drug/metabolite transporter (DMT)-like permease